MDDYHYDDEEVGRGFGSESIDTTYAYAEGFDWMPSMDDEEAAVLELFGE